MVNPVIEGNIMKFYVSQRPGVDRFLEEISEKFELVTFTAGIKQYASLVLDALDPNGVITHRLYRDSCRELEGRYVKDLAETGRDLGKLVIVDDNPNSYSLQPGNAIPIILYLDDVNDRELLKSGTIVDSPEISPELIHSLRQSNFSHPYFFARKFSSDTLKPLMQIADSVIFRD